MATPNHKHYREQEIWDPLKILEWGRTFHDQYALRFTVEEIGRQKAAIELMLRQCYLKVTPNIKLRIYWTLQRRYFTFSRSIERVFGKIFIDLEKRARSQHAGSAAAK